MKKIILFIFTALLVSCGNSKLSHEEALEILKVEYKLYCSIGIGGKWMDKRSWEPLENLKRKGLITLQTRRNNDIWKKEYKVVSLTAQGREFFDDSEKNNNNRQQVFIAKYEPVEILGISYKENSAQVKFKTKLVTTPFHSLINIYNKPRCFFDIQKNNFKEEVVVFTTYDTGWHLNTSFN